jgi:NADPH-dependent glutamate synthase beta subunit-like oxidoreductase
VSFFGNVEAGRDVQLDDLLTLYDAVILATGAARDRRLGVPGEDLCGVLGSREFVNWYNGHPDGRTPAVSQVRSAVVIGNGNVAIDVARILAKSTDELAGSDVGPEVAAWLSTQPLREIHIVGRRGAADTKFNEHELAELGQLRRSRPVVNDAASLPGDNAVVKTLRGFAEAAARETPVTIHFHFHLIPSRFVGDGTLREVQFLDASDLPVSLPAGLAVTSIGYETLPCGTIAPANGAFANQDGKIGERLYVVGWAKRGPSGTIPTNRVEAQQVAQKIAQEISHSNRLGRRGLEQILEQRGTRRVDYAGWRKIDTGEVSHAGSGRVRQKFTSIDEMLDAALVGQLKPA